MSLFPQASPSFPRRGLTMFRILLVLYAVVAVSLAGLTYFELFRVAEHYLHSHG